MARQERLDSLLAALGYHPATELVRIARQVAEEAERFRAQAQVSAARMLTLAGEGNEADADEVELLSRVAEASQSRADYLRGEELAIHDRLMRLIHAPSPSVQLAPLEGAPAGDVAASGPTITVKVT